jgi:hypothetical protein
MFKVLTRFFVKEIFKKGFYHVSSIFLLALFLISSIYDGKAYGETNYIFDRMWGSYGTGDGQFDRPYGLSVDALGDVYVADGYNERIQKFDSNGNYLTQWGTLGYGQGQFVVPRSSAVDSSDNVYVIDAAPYIRKFDSNGTFLKRWGGFGHGDGMLWEPYGISVDSSGNVYVADTHNSRIQKFDSNGNYLTQWGSVGSGIGQFKWPSGIAIDSSDNIYVADSQNYRIQKFDSNGNYLTQWGGVNGYPLYTRAIATDGADNVYVAIGCISGNDCGIMKFDSNGGYLGMVGSFDAYNSGCSSGKYFGTGGITVDGAGSVYVTDTSNNCVLKYVLYNADTTPDAFSFTPQTDVPLNTLITSNTITVSGIDTPVKVLISGGEYSVNSGPFTFSPAMVSNGDTITVRQISADSCITTTTVRLTVGIVSGEFSVTTTATDIKPDPFVFTPQTGVAFNTVVTSNTIIVSGINASSPVSITGGEYSINEGAFTNVSGTVNNGDNVTVRQTSADSFSTTTIATLTIGGVSGVFSVTTLAMDTTPDPFVFTPQTGVAFNTLITSNTIIVSGINAPATVSIISGEYSVNGGAFTNVSGMVNNGDNVAVRQTSADSFSTTTIATFTIGDVSGVFSVTTIAKDTFPDPFAFTPQTEVTLKTWITSNTITVSGINAPAPISVYGGEYSINGGAFTNASGTVNNGDNVAVRLYSSGSYATTTTAVLAIGGLGSEFSVTTIAFLYITVNSGANGSIEPSGSVPVSYGYAQAFNITTDTGYYPVVSGTCGGVLSELEPTIYLYETNPIVSDCTVAVSFQVKIFTVTPILGSGGNGNYQYAKEWGSYGTGNGQFSFPVNTVVDSWDNIYIVDWHNNRIQKFNSNGDYLAEWPSSGGPTSAVDRAGNFYAATDRIWKYDSNGTLVAEFGYGYIGSAWDVSVDAYGNIYVSDGMNYRIVKFNSNGQFVTQWGSYGTGNGQFSMPCCIAFDSAGNVYVVDMLNNRIQKFTPDGVYLSQWGSYGTGNGQFNMPCNIAIDAQDKIFITDTANNRIQKFDSNGVYLTQFGAYGTGIGQFDSPHGVAVDSFGNVYVADSMNNRIQKFSFIPPSEACGRIEPSTPQSVPYSETTSFSLIPDEGCHISSVSGCGGALTDNIYTTGPITADCDVKAAFAVDPTYTLTVSKTGTGSGTVTSSPNGINCGAVCSASYNNGTAVTLTASPTTGSKFAGWSGDSDCSDGQVTMSADVTCTATFNLLPLAPSSLTAQPTSSTSIVLGWQDNSDNETGSKIERKSGDCASANSWAQIATKTANTTTHTNTGLTANTTYAYRVRAYNAEGDSAYSNCASATTGLAGTPKSPTGLKATSASANQINLAWTDNSTNETGFEIYRQVNSGSFSLVKTKAANGVSYSDTTATGNNTTTTYSYYIRACNASGCSPSTNTAAVPFKPTGIATSAVSSTQINLSWTDNSSNETGFEVYRKAGNCASTNTWTLINTTAANATSFNNTGLTSGQTYSYRIRALTKSAAAPYANGYSGYTGCSSKTTP